ncbi:MAG: hypothetical protein L0229_30055, partial [Blastocatellia bacterium]|nr:hypothetical protein [Blastocatellia bacterium]
YAAILNRGQVPADFTGMFAQSGVTLNNATVQVIKANEEWVLNNPDGNNAGNDPAYPIKATRTTMNIFATGDPQTPVFPAAAGTPVRFRLVFPGGSTNNTPNQPAVLYVHGHGWQEEPFVQDSTVIGDNTLSQWFGSEQMAIYQTFNFVLPSAGGPQKVAGDYLYAGYQQEDTGIWGLMRVYKADLAIGEALLTGTASKTLKVSGTWTGARTVTIRVTSKGKTVEGDATVNPNGTWSFRMDNVTLAPGDIVTATSSDGAVATRKIEVPNIP